MTASRDGVAGDNELETSEERVVFNDCLYEDRPGDRKNVFPDSNVPENLCISSDIHTTVRSSPAGIQGVFPFLVILFLPTDKRHHIRM